MEGIWKRVEAGCVNRRWGKVFFLFMFACLSEEEKLNNCDEVIDRLVSTFCKLNLSLSCNLGTKVIVVVVIVIVTVVVEVMIVVFPL